MDSAIDRFGVQGRLSTLGLDISQSTISKYAAKELVTQPSRGSHGQHEGSFSYYHPGAHIEVATAHLMQKDKFPLVGRGDKLEYISLGRKYTVDEVRLARKLFIENLDRFNNKAVSGYTSAMLGEKRNLNLEEYLVKNEIYKIRDDTDAFMKKSSGKKTSGLSTYLNAFATFLESRSRVEVYYEPKYLQELYTSVFLRLVIWNEYNAATANDSNDN